MQTFYLRQDYQLFPSTQIAATSQGKKGHASFIPCGCSSPVKVLIISGLPMLGLFAPIFLTCLRILIDRISPFKAQLGGSHTYSLVTLKTTFGLPHLPTLLVALRMNLTKSLSMALNFPLFIPSHVTTLLSQVSFTFEVLNICVFLPMTLHLYEFFYVLINATTILSSH